MRITTDTTFTGFRVQRLEWSGGVFVNINASGSGGDADARIELLTAAEARALGGAAAEAERLLTAAEGGEH